LHNKSTAIFVKLKCQPHFKKFKLNYSMATMAEKVEPDAVVDLTEPGFATLKVLYEKLRQLTVYGDVCDEARKLTSAKCVRDLPVRFTQIIESEFYVIDVGLDA
jgi:hypothetical protein